MKLKSMKRKDFEIMAPAGSRESLAAAIQGGTDSVYFGAEQLNMRAGSSNNFTLGDLRDIVKICRDSGVRSYLAVNVVVYDKEMDIMRGIVDVARESGIDAIIASDIAAIDHAFRAGLEVHLSTQLNISNIEALSFFASRADVAVLARELDLGQVRRIHEMIKERDIRGPKGDHVKIEMFIHGALCMAISGKCYLSLHENNTSANRGNCYQTCRKSYIVTEKETGFQLELDNEYIMSPKDLCTIGFLDELIAAGVSIFKIEGRARSAEYVKIVTSCYNEAINAIVEGKYGVDRVKEWMTRLSSVYNRGFWDGYYLGKRLGEWSTRYGSSASMKKIYLGKITNYFARVGVAEIKLENGNLRKDDHLLIMGPTTGVIELRPGEIWVDMKVTVEASRGDYCSVKTNDRLRRSDKVYKWVDAAKEFTG
jgi:putative protease